MSLLTVAVTSRPAAARNSSVLGEHFKPASLVFIFCAALLFGLAGLAFGYIQVRARKWTDTLTPVMAVLVLFLIASIAMALMIRILIGNLLKDREMLPELRGPNAFHKLLRSIV